MEPFEVLERYLEGAPPEMKILLDHARERRTLLQQALDALEHENPTAPLTRQQAATLAALSHDAAISYANACSLAATLAVNLQPQAQ